MAKVGTAHLEIKPVLNEEALDVIAAKIQEAVERGVRAALGEQSIEHVVKAIEAHDYNSFLRAAKAKRAPNGPINLS